MKHNASLPRETGFTLMEVLIGTTLLGIMVLLLVGSLRIGAQSWDTGEERMQKANRMFIAQNFLRFHVGGLLPVTESSSRGQTSLVFRGANDRLEYVAPMPTQLNLGGLFRFQLYLKKNGDTDDLRLAILPYFAPSTVPNKRADNPEPVDDLALLENVRGVHWFFMARPDTGDKTKTPEWVEEWNDNQLPALIRVEIEPADEPAWPSLVIALRTQAIR